MDSSAPVNLKNNVWPRITAATMRQSQLTIRSVLECEHIKVSLVCRWQARSLTNYFPFFSTNLDQLAFREAVGAVATKRRLVFGRIALEKLAMLFRGEIVKRAVVSGGKLR